MGDLKDGLGKWLNDNHGGTSKVKITTKAFGVSLMVVLLTGLVTSCNRGPSDEALTQNVQAKLKADSTLTTAPITVSTASGVVTLAGEVKSDANKSRAEQIAHSVEGVKSVNNSLTVKPEIPVIAKDDPLKTEVMANLAKYGITSVAVAVANGEVTLTGTIPRPKLQDALKAANEAHPKKVNNQLTIN